VWGVTLPRETLGDEWTCGREPPWKPAAGFENSGGWEEKAMVHQPIGAGRGATEGVGGREDSAVSTTSLSLRNSSARLSLAGDIEGEGGGEELEDIVVKSLMVVVRKQEAFWLYGITISLRPQALSLTDLLSPSLIFKCLKT
jgi:hypothetical protein